MSKFDDFILGPITLRIQNKNREENRKTKPVTNTYKKYDSTVVSTKRVIKRLKAQVSSNGITNFKDWPEEAKNKYLVSMSKLKRNFKIKQEVPYLDKKNAIIRLVYTRYADDWVIFCNGPIQLIEEIKERIADFLLEDLGLVLSPEKTKITNAKKERVKFLSDLVYAIILRIKRL